MQTQETADRRATRAGVHERRSAEAKRRQRWEVAVIVAAAVGAFFFAFLQSRAPQVTDGSGLINNVVFVLLINLNIILLVLLVFLVGRNLLKLFYERRRKLPGAHLRTRLVLAFLAISLFPAVLLFLIGVGFLTNSIENWFALRVEQSLGGSIEVVDGVYTRLSDRTLDQAREVADALAPVLTSPRAEDVRARLAAELPARGVARLAVYSPQLTFLAGVAETRGAPVVPQLDAALLERMLAGAEDVRPLVTTDAAELTYAGAPMLAGDRPLGLVVAGSVVPPEVVGQSRRVADALGEYRQFRILKQPIKNNYVITMVLVTLVVVFAAIWVGLYLARKITGPLQQLSDATREVARGHWTQRIEAEGEDEIGTLVSAFNRMTVDLRQSHQELDARRRYMEMLLGNMNAGVVSFDRDGRLSMRNPAAERLLGLPADVVSRDYRAVFAVPAFAEVRRIVDELLPAPAGARAGRPQHGHLRLDRDGQAVSLLVTGTVLPDGDGHVLGVMCFFEDVTQIVQIERMEAWREVACRIAHEIKNPLTPIQLAAQRLHRRFAPALADPGGVFDECVQSIAHEVDAIKKLVNEFSQFARLPAGDHAPADLNALTRACVVLLAEAHRDLDIVFTPDPTVPTLELDREGMRRAVRNLLDNAVAACRAAPNGTAGRVDVATRYFAAVDTVRLEVADTGCGIPPDVREHVFEPHFSTKTDGSGLGLAIVATVVADHQAFIRVRDNAPRGSRFIIEIPVRRGARHTQPAESVSAEPAV